MAFFQSPRPTLPARQPPATCGTCGRTVPARAPLAMKSKRRRPKPPESESAPAPRIEVGTSTTLSLRKQLQLAKAAAHTDAPTRPVVRTKFRRKKVVAPRAPAPDQADVPDGKYLMEPDPVLYIDAYNVIGAWPRLRKWRAKGDMETARQLLIADVAEYSHVRGWECVLVFDAHGNDEDARTVVTPQEVTVVFTGGETADSYIERCVFEMCEAGDRQVWAATSDVAQLSFSRAKGAHIMSSSLFVQEIKHAKRETREKMEQIDEGTAGGQMFIASVDKRTRDRLYQLRDKLDGG